MSRRLLAAVLAAGALLALPAAARPPRHAGNQRDRLRPAGSGHGRVPRAEERQRLGDQPRSLHRRAGQRQRRRGLPDGQLPAVSLAAGDHYLICATAATTAGCDLRTVNSIQNGDPDAVALRLGAALVDTVSYGGNTVAPYTEGTGAGRDTGAAPRASRAARTAPTATATASTSCSARSRPAPRTTVSPPPPPPFGACGDGQETRIHTIQGTEAASPVAGSVRTIEGVVVGDFQGAGGLNGFFVQEETATATPTRRPRRACSCSRPARPPSTRATSCACREP